MTIWHNLPSLMFSIQLENLVFKSFHGLYPEEKIIGTNFIVNLSVQFVLQNDETITIDDTINYEVLFEIVSIHMKKPKELLENLVVNITKDILNRFNQIKQVSISITKKNPPIHEINGDVTVSYQIKRD